jgi:hypothetical protein
MSKGNPNNGNQQGQSKEPEAPKVDEFAVGAFESLGVKVTQEVADTYNEFKRLKDKIQPGRLKPSEFVTCVMLASKEQK